MARRSRKGTAASECKAVPSSGKIYQTAVYVRLSREDERKIESDTVENQIDFLKDHVEKDASLALVDTYVDRHVTGTKFDRPEFNRMMADIRAGRINCVVVKDLSRLGRNYLEAGDYIEKIFPFFGVRFVAVTDNYDSLASNVTEEGLVVPLKNLINEAYAKDVSKKICTTFEAMNKKGIFLATTAAYGYVKDPDDSHNLLVDEEVRDVVLRVYRERLEGASMAQIARSLNEDGIPAPSVYWQNKGVIHKQKYTNKWEGKQIRRILTNVVYVGDVEISKTYKAYYKGITKPVTRDKKDRYCVKDHHEAIIDRKTFEEVQKMAEKTVSEYKSTVGRNDGVRNQKEDMLQGLLFCGHCRNKLNLYRKTVKLVNGYGYYSTYICKRSSYYGEADPKKNIKAEKMENMVLELIQKHISVYLDAREKLKELNRKPKAAAVRGDLERRMQAADTRKGKVEEFIQNLYADFADGIFSEKEYLEMKSGYAEELVRLEEELKTLEAEKATYSDVYAGDGNMAETFAKYAGSAVLSKEMAAAFIRRIYCYENDRFEVEYTFTDELKSFLGLVEQRGAETV